jgi:ribonuclease BN (tRNA processing enzyme)
MRGQVVRLCEGADLVIYDTMFTPEEYRQTPHFGHSRPSDAVDICRDAGARMLALYHHAPDRSDAEVDAVLASTRKAAKVTAPKLDIVAGFEGLDVALGKG